MYESFFTKKRLGPHKKDTYPHTGIKFGKRRSQCILLHHDGNNNRNKNDNNNQY